MQSLRAAVEHHVHTARSRGAELSEIDRDLQSMIEAAGCSSDHADYPEHRVDEVTRQVLKWSASFYTPRT